MTQALKFAASTGSRFEFSRHGHVLDKQWKSAWTFGEEVRWNQGHEQWNQE